MLQMQLGHHRARRYSFHAGVELTDLQSETQTKEQTSDLSLFGCHVDTLKPLPPGTKVRIKISHRSEHFEALGKVANARQNAGMGVFFTRIEPHDQLVLDKWIAELRDQYSPPSGVV
ncbi:MAG TPA: PilZ domain-containing protein [Candidatus Acidoferrum sp.]|nr:PilZ domain-containing protein [Candidatus Acidoferrum sp.]